MSHTHSIDAHDLQGNRYRLTIYREMIGPAPRDEFFTATDSRSATIASPATMSIPIDVIGPRGEWVNVLRPGRYLLQPLEKDQDAIELFSDEPLAP